MEGIGLDNMLGAEEVERLFGGQATPEETQEPSEKQAEVESPASDENKENSNTEQTAEVDFSDLLGNQPESVGSEETTVGNGETPESKNDSGTSQNLFSSIAKALKDEGVFPDLPDDAVVNIKDATSFKKLFDDEIARALDERQKRIENALNSGAPTKEVQEYNQALSIAQFLDSKETADTLSREDEEGEKLRKQMMYQNYVNRGFKHERAVKLIEKSFEDGTDIEDAKEAFEDCKEFYNAKVNDFQKAVETRQKENKAYTEKQYDNLKKRILDTESFYDGVKVDKAIRQKAYDSITKPVHRDDNGNYLTALQQYQREHPMEFMENVAILYALTDNFKNVDKLTKGKVKAGLKKGFAELENVLNNSRRNSDGTLNLANVGPDDSEREKWTLAM